MNAHRPPCLIGLTGNIATGKSTVASMLVDLGARAIDADKVAHETMVQGTDVQRRIVDTFGSEILTECATIDRKKLADIVFSNAEALKALEEIVHPATLRRIDQLVAASQNNVIVIEAIKLLESGLAARCDAVWVTTCSVDEQIRRLTTTRNLTAAEAKKRIEAQSPQQAKMEQADVIIDTSVTLADTRTQVIEAWRHAGLENIDEPQQGT